MKCKSKTLLLPLLLLSFFSTYAIASPLNITIGSSLSTTPLSDNDESYWLSPSGNYAFGFYPLPCKTNDPVAQCYVVGIWNARSATKTLVWVANRDSLPFSGSSSILFTKYGTLVRISGDKEIALLSNIQEPASYAMINDNGNLVLYNSDSRIMWESFDYPTDTILPGQTLKSGFSLIASTSRSDHSSGRYILRITNDGDILIYHDYDFVYAINRYYKVRHVDMNLDSNGNLYLVDQNGLNIGSLTKGKMQTDNQNSSNPVIFRATLDSDGIFRLYREEIGSGKEKSWRLSSNKKILFVFLRDLLFVVIFVGILSCIYHAVTLRKNQPTQGELQLGTV
ncbi:G-type lectin S-receptor-like serine/threonine-protein kinase LECRK2 [Thalictrum thalictroides]|uniref:G-type lectin S-receptor-like serine/threonine-protein kinase LECRK2 n=1 Tax=Thalictrum thalictroides TaxID=46969 RepID=A0A7J6VQY8_THATH|nr:G-type lectin S-receptor-like serine/threonine-protein kinase LECRK2 [Thalictrum thalictroides]